MTSKGALALVGVVLLLALPAVAQTTQPAATGNTIDCESLIAGNPEASITTLKEYLKASPRDGQALHALGYLLLKTAKATEAAGFFTRAAACGAAGPAFTYNQSLAMLRTGQAVRAAGTLAKHFQSGGTTDERMIDLFGDSIDRSTRTASISNAGTKKAWDDTLASNIQILEQNRPGMRKWGTRWLNSSEWAPIQTSISAYETKLHNAEREYDEAVESRKDAESRSRAAQKSIPDAQARDSWYKRDLVESANRAKEAVRRAQDKERDAKRALDQVRSQAPRPAWEDLHAPIWGNLGSAGTVADSGATIARGMTLEEVHGVMGIDPASLTEDEAGFKTRVYEQPDRTVRVRFKNERVVSFEEYLKPKPATPSAPAPTRTPAAPQTPAAGARPR